MNLTTSLSSPANTRLPTILRNLPIFLFLGDIIGFVACLQLAYWWRLGQPLSWLEPLVYGFSLILLIGLYLSNAYQPDTQIAGLRAPARIILCIAIVCILTTSLIYFSGTWGKNPLVGRKILFVTLGFFSIWAVSMRLCAVNWVRSHAQQSRWLMLGAEESAVEFVDKLLALNPFGKVFVLAEANQKANKFSDFRVKCLGNLDDLTVWSQQTWSAVVVATQTEFCESQVRQLMSMRLRGIPVYRLPDFYETLWYKIPSSVLQDQWLAFSAGFNLMPGYLNMKLKRVTDLILAGLLLVILFPLMLLVAALIKLDSPGAVFYSQLRTGQHGNPFRVYKFRSMYQDAEKRGVQWASKRDPRITRVGNILRLARIDELPQIWNVLRGDMSLIGPRPERPEFDTNLKKEIPYYDLRYLVKPGITGWAQVMYPYGASVEDAYEKLAYDLYYIKNYSLWLDIAIFFKTIRVVLLGKGR